VNQDFTNGSNVKVKAAVLPQLVLMLLQYRTSDSDNRHNFGKFTSFWQRLSLRTKATAMAVALSTLPVLVIGTAAYYLTKTSRRA